MMAASLSDGVQCQGTWQIGMFTIIIVSRCRWRLGVWSIEAGLDTCICTWELAQDESC